MLATRLGARGPALWALAAYAAGLPLVAAAPSVMALAAVLFAMGLANGILDVAMNVEGVAVERRGGRRVLGSMHAAFSFGGMAGAGLGGGAAAAGMGPEMHLTLVAAVVLVGAAVATAGLPATCPVRCAEQPFGRPSRRLVLLAAVGFCVLLGEGSVADWSAVYLNEGTGASEGLAAAGLAVFSLAMAFGVRRRQGGRGGERAVVIRTGALLAAAGLGMGLVVTEPAAGIAGYAVMGVGLSACFPLVLAAAAQGSENAEAASIAVVSGAGYIGLTVVPAMIGVLSDAAGLRQALLLVVALALVASALAGAAEPDDGPSVGYRDPRVPG